MWSPFPRGQSKIITEAEGKRKQGTEHYVCKHKFDLANCKHTVAGKEMQAQTTAADLRDCNRRGALEYVTGL